MLDQSASLTKESPLGVLALPRAILETIPAGAVVCDASGEITFINRVARGILGDLGFGNVFQPNAEYTFLRRDGSPFLPEDLPLARALSRGAIEHDVDLAVRRPDGSLRNLLVASGPIRNARGHITGALVVFQDITKRERAEEALAKSEESLAIAQQIARVGNWDLDLTTNQLYLSKEAYRILGVQPDKFVVDGASILPLIHPLDRDYVKRSLYQAAYEKKPYIVDYRISEPGVVERFVHCEGMVTEEADGKPVRMIGTIQDVTAKRQAKKEYDRLLARQQAIAQIAQALVQEVGLAQVVGVILDQSVKVMGADVVGIWVADRARRQLTLLESRGKTPESLNLIRQLSYDSPSLSARAAKTQRILFAEDCDTVRADLSLGHHIAELEHVRSLLGLPLCSRAGLVGVVTFGSQASHHFHPTDLEFYQTVADLFAVAIENAQLYDAVRLGLRLREEFMSAAAHELKTPVTVIKGRAQLLLSSNRTDASVRPSLEAIDRQADRISRLIEDLLGVIRLHRSTSAMNRTPLDVNEVVRTMVEQIARTTEGHRFNLQTTHPLVVDGDRALIAEVVGHLLENAIRYSPEAGLIDVQVSRQNDEAWVAVTDHGVGITPGRQPHVFEPFYEPVPPGEHGYLGLITLGLALSKDIIEAHGGRIWLTSTPGHGSTFSFSLPITSH